MLEKRKEILCADTKEDIELENAKKYAEEELIKLRRGASIENEKIDEMRKQNAEAKDLLQESQTKLEASDKRVESFDKNVIHWLLLNVNLFFAYFTYFLSQLAKKRQAKQNTEAQLAALESQSKSLANLNHENQRREASVRASTSEIRRTSTLRESDVQTALRTQEKVEAAVAAMVQQTARLEAKVKAMEAEKARILRKINCYEEASQQFCFSFSSVFGVPTTVFGSSTDPDSVSSSTTGPSSS
jgi:hypothetical protein